MFELVCLCVRLAVPDPEENHYGGSETESEAAYLDKDYWVQRAGEVSVEYGSRGVPFSNANRGEGGTLGFPSLE